MTADNAAGGTDGLTHGAKIKQTAVSHVTLWLETTKLLQYSYNNARALWRQEWIMASE